LVVEVWNVLSTIDRLEPGTIVVGCIYLTHHHSTNPQLPTGMPSVLSPKYEVFCCDQNGPPARRSEPDWR
jgi:hypothetical protein